MRMGFTSAACLPMSCARVRAGFTCVPSSATVITRFLQVSASFQSGLLPEDPPPTPSPSPDAKTLSGQQRVCSASILSLRIRCGSDWKRPPQAHAPRSPGNPSTCGRKPGEARFLRPQSHWTWSARSLDGSFLLGCYLEKFPQTPGFTGLASPPPGAWWDRARRSGTWSEQRGLDPTGGRLLRHITKHILESWHLPAGLSFKLTFPSPFIWFSCFFLG